MLDIPWEKKKEQWVKEAGRWASWMTASAFKGRTCIWEGKINDKKNEECCFLYCFLCVLFQESHHTVLGDAFKERYITKPHSKPVQFDGFEKKSKMHCQNTECQHDWGIIVKYKTFDNLPVIKIKSFVLENVETGTQTDLKKWKSINLSLKNFDEETSIWT